MSIYLYLLRFYEAFIQLQKPSSKAVVQTLKMIISVEQTLAVPRLGTPQ